MGWTPVPRPIESFAPAKINLFLHVGDKRDDGYHALESIAAFVDVGDKLAFAPADSLTLRIDGPFGEGLAGESDNLVLRAARVLAEHAGIEAHAAITLTKNLPLASGIGGGSADAAAALRGLVQLWDLTQVGPIIAREIAETLGSDVPVCVESRPSWMEGRGEIVTFVRAVPPIKVVLVNPGIAVPTAAVFGALKARSGVDTASRILFDRDAWSMADYLQSTRNDLEEPALGLAPVIGEVLAALRAQPGVYLARMSGSGATCFAFFENDAAAEAAADTIAKAHPNWWVKAARILA